MEPQITSFQYHGGAPLISTLSRTPGYRIAGTGFGDQRGQVEIEYGDDGETRSQRIKSWSDTFIEIGLPSRDPLNRGACESYLTVTRADGERSRPFEIVPPGDPYLGYIRPQDRPASRLRRAA